MIIAMLSVTLISSVFFMFSFTYTYVGLNRTITSSPKSVFENSIPLTSSELDTSLYFDEEMVKNSYSKYLEKEVTKYVKEYEVNYYFYNTENGGVCEVKKCQGVEITFSCDILYFSHYKRVIFYEIREGVVHG